MRSDTPRIYIACLRAYNEGTLHGEWVDITDEDTLREDIARVLASSPANLPDLPCEEHAFHDMEYLPGIGEYSSVEEVCAIAELVDEHGYDLVKAAYDCFSNPDEMKTALSERYQGTFDSLEDYGADYMEQTGMFADIPESLRYYFDFEKWARDCELSGDISIVRLEGTGGKIAVFSNH